MEGVKKVQERIDVLQDELQAKLQKLIVECDEKKNEIYARRTTAIAAAQKEGNLPASFWSAVILSHPVLVNDFFGPYDAHLVEEYMTEMKGAYTATGMKVTFLFKANPFFEETELWAEVIDAAAVNKDEDMPEGVVFSPEGHGVRCSGITWKEGHGPDLNGELDEEDQEDDGSKKRKQSGDDGKVTTRGASFLDVFSTMPQNPQNDQAYDDEDDEVVDDAIEEWDHEMQDRQELIAKLIGDVWSNPLLILQDGNQDDDDDEEDEEDEDEPATKAARQEA